jgi:hypothetical protein
MLKVYIISLLCIMAFRVPAREMGIGGSNHLYKGSNLECRSELLGNLADTMKNPDKIHSDSKRDLNMMNLFKKSNTADLFVKVYTDKTNCFVGEPILATYKLYSRVNSKSTITRQPKLEGFRVFDLLEIISIASSTEIVRGISFQVHTIKKAQLVPLQTGNLQVDAIELGNRVHYAMNGTEDRNNNIHLDEMLNGLLKEECRTSKEHLVSVRSKPVHIRVNPLPTVNRPAAFSGAIGRFTIKASLGTTSQDINDMNNLTIELSGIGYWSITEAPGVLWPRDIESISVESSTEADRNGNPLKGKKVFKYFFVPKKAGKFMIPSVSFTFFETNIAGYKTVETTPLRFDAGFINNVTNSGQNARRIIRANTANNLVHGRSFVWIGIFISMLVVLALAFLLKKRQLFHITRQAENTSNGLLTKTGERVIAQSIPADSLEEIRMLVDNTSNKEFYTTLHSLLWKQLHDKLVLPQTVLNKANVCEKLESFGWNKENIKNLDSILTECEQIVYLPEYKTYVDRRHLLNMAEVLINLLNELSNVPILNV